MESVIKVIRITDDIETLKLMKEMQMGDIPYPDLHEHSKAIVNEIDCRIIKLESDNRWDKLKGSNLDTKLTKWE